MLARMSPIQPPASTAAPVGPLKEIDLRQLAGQPSSGAADPGQPQPLPHEPDATFLEYQQRAGARRSGCGENASPTPVQRQFIPAWSQQPMIYPEVPLNERATAWLLTETYQSDKHEPAVTNDPHHAQREDTRLQQPSDDGCLPRLRSVHVQPEESGPRGQIGVAVGPSRPRQIA